MAEGGDDVQINISYDLDGRDPKEVDKLLRKIMKDLAKAGNFETDAYKVLPQETGEQWELQLTTGNQGSSSPIELHICGVKGDEKPIELKKNVKGDDAFLPGQVDKFNVTISDSIGDVFKLRFGFPDSVAEETWHLKGIRLYHTIDKDTFETTTDVTVRKNKTLDPWQEIPVVWPDYPMLPTITYQLYLTTSIKSGRMESGAQVILYGDYGNTGVRDLKKSANSKVKFQPGQNDRFEIPAVKLGEIRKVWLKNDCSANHKNWLVDKAIVKESTEAEHEWLFRVQRYFDPNKGDRHTERILEYGKELDSEPDENAPVRPKTPPKPKPKPAPPPPPPPPREPTPPPPEPKPKKEKKKKEKKPPTPPPKEDTPPPPAELEEEESAEEDETPNKKAPNDDWIMWWENREEQKEIQGARGSMTFIGDRDESDEIKLEFNLVKGKSKKFRFEMDPDHVGDLIKLRMRLGDEVKKKTRWEIAKLNAKHLRSGEIHVFNFEKAIVKRAVDTATEASSENVPLRTYVCSLHAGNRHGLSPDSRAYLIIRGENGDTGKRWIVNPEEGKQGLNKHDVLTTEIDSVDLGQVTGIRVGHDEYGKSPSYFLEKIIVRPSHRADVQYVFTFKEPVAKKSDKSDTRKSDDDEVAAQTEEQQGQKYDPQQWQMAWTNEDNQPKDFLQIAAILFGKKGQSTSYFIDVELGPGDSDGYLIRVEQDIGELIKVRMSNGPKVKGKHPWLIRELRLKHLLSGRVYSFQLGGGGGDSGTRKYKVEVYYTVKGLQAIAGARLHIKLFGDKTTTDRLWLDNKALKDNPSITHDSFDIELADLGEVKNMRLGHNKKNKQIGFFVSKVVVKAYHLPNKEWVFTIPYVEEEEKDVPQSEWLISWNCSESQRQVLTTVIIVLYGDEGRKTPDIAIQTMLRPGQSEETLYMMEKPRQFKLYKVRVGFWEKQYDPIIWNLKWVRVRCVQTRTIYTFTLNNIVFFNEEKDGWREIAIDVPPDQRRPPMVTYEIQCFTSKEVSMVTDSKIHIMLNGRMGDTGKRKLLRSLNNGFKNFIPGRMDTFRIEAVDLDDIESILVGHNDTGRYPSWHCERMIITDRHGGQVYEFDMNKWFDKKRSDRKIEREFNVTRLQRAGLGRKWFVRLKTGDHPRCHMKTSLGLIICGSENTSDVVLLGKQTGIETFKPKETYELNVEIELDDIEDVVGEVFKIRLGFLDWNQWPALLITEVFLEELATNCQYYVDVNEWIWANPRHDGWREFQVRGPAQNLKIYSYQLAIWTGTEVQADTNADVYCQIFGSKGETGKRRLCTSKTHIRPFQLGQMDLFDIEAVDLGDIKKIMFMLIAEEAKDNWHLVKLTLQQHPFNGEEFLFENGRWFDNANHTQVLTPTVRNEGKTYTGPTGEHLVLVTTGSRKDLKTTTSTVSLMVFGDRGQAGPFILEHPPVLGPDGLPVPPDPKDRPFQPGGFDFFPVTINDDQVGRIVKARISHSNKGKVPRWFLEKIAIQHLTNPRADTHHFVVNDWLSDDKGDGELTREFATEHPAEPPLPYIRYRVEVGAGSKISHTVPYDVDIIITLHGNSIYNSGPRRLKKNVDSSKAFAANKVSAFYVSAVGVGDVTKVTIGHTCPDARFKLHVREVTVSWDPNNRITFPCDELIVKTKPNVPAEVTLTAR